MNSLLCMHSILCRTVKSLTLVCVISSVVSLSGCAYIHGHYGETCNSHAYIKQDLEDYITTRFSSSAPVRMAIIPYSVPANLSTKSPEFPGVDRLIAQQVHATFLSFDQIPIVEVLNRQDWPGKKEEFFTGNFGTLARAREAGYDLVLVGSVDRPTSLTSLTTHTKLIDVESGVTLYYGKNTVTTGEKEYESMAARFGAETRRPDLIYTNALIEEMARCVVEKILSIE